MIKSSKNRFLILIITFILIFSSIFIIRPVKADTTFLFDETDIMDDLQSSEDFDLNDYPWDLRGVVKDPGIINFVEWCYSPFNNNLDYALYIYFYNPQNVKVDKNSTRNKIQIATGYDTAVPSRNSVPTDYTTFDLKCVSVSDVAGCENLFYKFRVVDKKDSQNVFYLRDKIFGNERRYDLSGITLANSEGDLTEYPIGGTFYFQGYSSGCGPDESADSTLQCTGFNSLETISLDVHSTYWRSESSSKGVGYQNQLNSVYFSVPDKYFTEYGELQKIKAEWYEYKAEDIVITSDRDFYNKAINYINKTDLSDLGKFGLADGIYTDFYGQGVSINHNKWAWHPITYTVSDNGEVSPLQWLLPSKNFCEISENNPEADLTSTGGVLSEDLIRYMKNYSSKYGGEKVMDKYSKSLFSDTVDSGRIQGYNCVNIDKDEDLLSYQTYNDIEHTFWEKAGDFFRGYKPKDVGMSNLKPIVDISSSTMNMSNENLVDELKITNQDIEEFRSFYNKSKNNNEHTILFRFALTDYFAKYIDLTFVGNNTGKSNKSMRVNETFFFDFDIIQLTFKKNESYKVIPVVSTPFDIVPDITSPAYDNNGNIFDSIKDLDFFKKAEQGCNNFFLGVKNWLVLVIAIVVMALLLWLWLKIVRLIFTVESIIGKIILIAVAIAGLVGLILLGTYFYELVCSSGLALKGCNAN